MRGRFRRGISLAIACSLLLGLMTTTASARKIPYNSEYTNTIKYKDGVEYLVAGGTDREYEPAGSIDNMGKLPDTTVTTWYDVTTADGREQLGKLTDQVNTLLGEAASANFEDTTEKGVNRYMLVYLKSLAVADWMTRNWWTDEGDPNYVYNIFTLPLGNGTTGVVDFDKLDKMCNDIGELYSHARNAYVANPPLFNPSNYMEEFIFNSPTNGYAFRDLKTSGELGAALSWNPLVEDSTEYYDMIVSVLKYYIDANILYLVAKDQAIPGWDTVTTYEELLELVGNDDSLFFKGGYLDSLDTSGNTGENNSLPGTNTEEDEDDKEDDGEEEEEDDKPSGIVNVTDKNKQTAKDISHYFLNSSSVKDEMNQLVYLFHQLWLLTTTMDGYTVTNYSYKDSNGVEKKFTSYHCIREDGMYLDNMSHFFELLYSAEMIGNPDAVSPGSTDSKGETISKVDSTYGTFGLMVKGGKIVDGDVRADGDGELTDLGYVILSAGATYEPFISLAGNEAWLAVVNSFFDEDSAEAENVDKLLQLALNTKKPLYVTEGSRSSWSTQESLESISSGEFRYAFLEDILTINESSIKAYVMLKGTMTPSMVDGSTWDYTNAVGEFATDKNTSQVTIEDDNLDTEIDSDRNKPSMSWVKEELEKIENADKITFAGSSSIFATSSEITAPVMVTAGNKAAWNTNYVANGFAVAVGGLTSFMLHNSSVDMKDNKHIQNASKEMLFMNGLGDVVLADGTVILPAVANPLFYKYTQAQAADGDMETFVNSITDESGYQAYYPYTATFMNGYPSARITESTHALAFGNTLEIVNSGDLNKYIIILQGVGDEAWWDSTGAGSLYARQITKIRGSGRADVAQYGSVRTSHLMLKSFSVLEDEGTAYSLLHVGEATGGNTLRNWTLGIVGTPADDPFERAHMIFVCRVSATDGSGRDYFPLYYDTPDMLEEYLAVARPITTSTMRYVSDNDPTTGAKVSSGNFEIHNYIFEAMGQGMLGTQYSTTLVKNAQVSYEDLVNDQSGRFLKFLMQIADAACESLGKVDGVLAIKGPYDSLFFNVIFRFIQDFYLIIAVGLLIIVASRFFKGHFNLLYVAFMGFCCVFGFEVYANWMPTLVPQLYNFAVNDAIENIVWHTTFFNAESYSDTYQDADNVDVSSGTIKPYTGTITLYQLTNAEMAEVARRNGIPVEEIRKGTQVQLDETASIFVQGNLIKMSVDRLLVNNSMRGLYLSQWDQLGTDYTGTDLIATVPVTQTNNNPYSVQLVQPYVSLEAYYTPYDHIERAFMEQLNTFASYFRLERNMYIYGQGELYKDAFLVQNYLGSGIFVDPGNRDALRKNIQPGSVQVDVDDLNQLFTSSDVERLLDEVMMTFDPAEDWLGLMKIFAEPDEGVQHSLWGYVMQKRLWYTEDWKITEYGATKVTDMINYVNNQTKNWIIDNYEDLCYCSDENAIKMISLYATTCYTHYVSQISEWLFPNYLNASDIELRSVLYGSMVSLLDKNFAYDGTVVNTVGLNVGIFGILFLLLIVLFSAIFVTVITYMIPVLYALLGIVIIFKMINKEDGMGLIKGYVKVTLVSAILYFLFSLSLQLVEVGGYKWYSYLLSAICIFFCNYFLFWVVLSVVQDVGNLGNNTLMNNLLKGLNVLTRDRLAQLTSRNTQIFNQRRTTIAPRNAYMYGRGYNVDTYDRPRGRRSSVTSNSGDYTRGGPSASRSGASGYGRQDYWDDDLGMSQSSRASYSTRNRSGW